MLSLDSYLPVTLFQSNGDVPENSEPGDAFYMHHNQQDQQQQQRVLNKSLSFGSSDADYLADSVKDSLFAKFLPSNNEDEAFVDAYSCDDFRMYEFKVRRCMRGRSHDWTECPFAHPGEKARRRDPRRFHYSGTACPDFRKGSCRRGDACEFAHGVFECWLHPARYRTQPCKDGRNCKRRVCFFAHTQQQLRLLPGNSSSSPKSGGKSVLGSSGAYRHATGLDSTVGFESCANPNTSNRGFMKSNLAVTSSPTSTLVGHSHSPPPLSPPLSPTGSSSPRENSWPHTQALYQKTLSFDSALYNNTPPRRHPTITIPVSPDSRSMSSPLASEGSCSPFAQSSPKKSIADLINSLQNLELSNGNGANSVGGCGSRPWLQAHNSGACYAQSPPRSSNLRHCSYSLPCTPTKSGWDANIWEQDMMEEAPHRVESGRDLRAQIYGRLSREASEIKEANRNADSPDLAWVNDLIK